MRNGASGRHCAESKARAASGAVAAPRPDEAGARPTPSHVGERGGAVPVVDEAEAGEAARRGDDDRFAERRRVEAVGEFEVVAAIVAGRQRLMGDEQVVQPARPGQADVVGGVEHARRIAQQLARPLDRQRLQEGLRRQPGPALEHVLEVRRGETDMVGDRLDRRLVAPAGRDEFDRLAHDGVIGVGRDRDGGEIEHGSSP